MSKVLFFVSSFVRDLLQQLDMWILGWVTVNSIQMLPTLLLTVPLDWMDNNNSTELGYYCMDGWMNE